MNTKDMIWNEIYRGSMKSGASEKAAFDAAVTGAEDWRKNKFKTPSKLIEDKIKEARKQTKHGKR